MWHRHPADESSLQTSYELTVTEPMTRVHGRDARATRARSRAGRPYHSRAFTGGTPVPLARIHGRDAVPLFKDRRGPCEHTEAGQLPVEVGTSNSPADSGRRRFAEFPPFVLQRR